MPAQSPGGRAPMMGLFRRGPTARFRFRSPRFTASFTVAGVTRDSTGVALAGCTVELYESATDAKLATTTSDGSGNYSFQIGTNSGFFYVTAYKPGTPDVAGITASTLTAT